MARSLTLQLSNLYNFQTMLGRLAAGKNQGNPSARWQRDKLRRLLVHLASDLRKHVIGAAANQPDGANHNHQDYRQHDGIFGDVLTALFSPKLLNCFNHSCPQSTDLP